VRQCFALPLWFLSFVSGQKQEKQAKQEWQSKALPHSRSQPPGACLSFAIVKIMT